MIVIEMLVFVTWTVVALALGVLLGILILASEPTLRVAAEYKWTREKLDRFHRWASEEARREAGQTSLP